MGRIGRLLVLLLAACAPAHAGEVVLGGPAVKWKHVHPRFTAQPDLTSLGGFRQAQEAAGDLTLEKAVLTLEAEGDEPTVFVLTARKLTLRESRIDTNGHALIVHADRIEADPRSIIVTAATRDVDGPDGVDGAPGRPGGDVQVHLTSGLYGRVIFDLSGEDGQDGVDGTPGAQGRKGKKGKNAKARYGFCRRGPGRGRNGENGGDGTDGGNAGAGGNGGNLEVVFYNTPVELGSHTYDISPGTAGVPGAGGKGGAGGAGGSPGKNTSPCEALAGRGSPGTAGTDGSHGAPAADGQPGVFSARQIVLP